MTRESDLALLAAGSYWDIRGGRPFLPNIQDTDNRAPLPGGWKVLERFDKSDSGPTAVTGFSARVYQNTSTNEIVISYAGTEFGGASSVGRNADFVEGNIPLAVGKYSSHGYRAAALYQEVKAAGLTENIAFTGHSLGGGLAAIMAVWFNRPAYVYAPAPFQRSADINQVLDLVESIDGVTVTTPADQLNLLLPLVKAELLRRTGAIDPALASYNPSSDFSSRERNVKSWAVDGELLRYGAPANPAVWIEGATPTLLFTNPSNSLGMSEKHSIELHAAALLSRNFETQANKIPNALQLIYSDKLYGYNPLENQQHFMVKLVRNEVGIRRDDGTVLQAANGMLTHFANDLQKLGNNLTALSSAAQKAMVAQGIEWYYWQSTNYTGAKEFIKQTGSLLQYTTAIGDSLIGAENKAIAYTKSWLTEVQGAYSMPQSQIVRVDYSQWNIAAGNSASTATALVATKNQIFVGQDGADTFTGGDKDDMFFAGNGLNTVTGGAGNDVIYGGSDKDIQDGGEGNDQLYGGAGDDTLTGGAGNDNLQGGADNDTYQFDAAWGKDVITDSDGKGSITIGGQALGAAKGGGKTNVWVTELGAGSGQFVGMAVFDDASSSTGKKLIITKGTDTSNTIIINNFDLAAAKGAGYLGIKLDKTQHIALTQGNGTTQGASTPNVYADRYFNPSSLDGKNTQFKEGNGASFSVSLAVGAKAGDTVRLSVNGGLSGKLKTRVNGSLVDAGGASLTLREGQTLASFELVSEGEIEADLTGSISASYSGEESADSNSWDVTVPDAKTRSRNCARAAHRASGHYLFSSCSRNILLNYRSKTLVKSAATPARQVWL